MTDYEPEHVFRVESCADGPEYIAADYMVANETGIIRLLVREPGKVLGEPVAIIYPHPGLTVARVRNLITPEGLTQS